MFVHAKQSHGYQRLDASLGSQSFCSMKPVCLEPGIYALPLSSDVYSLEAIKRTAYKFADRSSVVISPGTGPAVSVIFNFAGKFTGNDPDRVISDFCNELLDQDLRGIIRQETGAIRNLIIAHAFSRTHLADEE
jgi:His-Xaa-Ser system protein HxsD